MLLVFSFGHFPTRNLKCGCSLKNEQRRQGHIDRGFEPSCLASCQLPQVGKRTRTIQQQLNSCWLSGVGKVTPTSTALTADSVDCSLFGSARRSYILYIIYVMVQYDFIIGDGLVEARCFFCGSYTGYYEWLLYCCVIILLCWIDRRFLPSDSVKINNNAACSCSKTTGRYLYLPDSPENMHVHCILHKEDYYYKVARKSTLFFWIEYSSIERHDYTKKPDEDRQPWRRRSFVKPWRQVGVCRLKVLS